MLFNSIRKARHSEGFTLIELLIVIVIIGVLATIGIPMYLNQAVKADKVKAKADVAAISGALVTGASTSTLSSTVIDNLGTGRTPIISSDGATAFVGTLFTDSVTQHVPASTVVYFATDGAGEVISWCVSEPDGHGGSFVITSVTGSIAVNATNIECDSSTTTSLVSGGGGGDGSATATGGALTSDATYYYRTFLADGTITITGSLTGDVLIIGGGGGGGAYMGGAGGAGGVVYASSISFTTSSINVGTGGAAGVGQTIGVSGTQSSYGTYIALGGGHGGNYTLEVADSGGSGGGAGGGQSTSGAGTASQGNAGGIWTDGYKGAGGGGAGAAGADGVSTTADGAAGGNGINTYSAWATVTGTGVGGYYAGGGGAGGQTNSDTPGVGGLGGGGVGGGASSGSGTSNTGSGGGGLRNEAGNPAAIAGSGGSGIVIIRYLKSAVA